MTSPTCCWYLFVDFPVKLCYLSHCIFWYRQHTIWWSYWLHLDTRSNIGPKTLPWGIPLVTSSKLELWPLSKTRCFLESNTNEYCFKRVLCFSARCIWKTPYWSEARESEVVGTIWWMQRRSSNTCQHDDCCIQWAVLYCVYRNLSCGPARRGKQIWMI